MIKFLKQEMTRKEFLAFNGLIVASVFGVVGLLKTRNSYADTSSDNGSALMLAAANASRNNLVALYGTYIPQPGLTANQVGITVPISQLGTLVGNTPNTRDFLVTSPMVWENKIIYGRLKISGAGKITARNCWFAGPPKTPPAEGETAILDFNDPGTSGSTFLDCTIAPRFPHPRLNGFKGSRHKVERCHIFWVTDGLGPYTNPGKTYATDVELVASRVERLVYWPGAYYANRNPYLWNGSTWSDGSTSGKLIRSGTDKNIADMIDDVHSDGNHNDCIEIHNAFGSHTFNTTTKKWTGNGIHIWGNALYADDAFGQNDDPSGAGIPVPGMAGSVSGSRLGWGDNPKRGLVDGGQKPGMAMPQTSWTNPMSTNPTKYAANGAALYIGHVTNVQFQSTTSVICHDNYINGGNIGMQEQKNSLPNISFYFYDNRFGPDYYMWNTGRDIYPVLINDGVSSKSMPDWTRGPVRIPNHPATGAPPFGSGGSNVWLDPANKWGKNGQPLGLGSSTVAGIRVAQSPELFVLGVTEPDASNTGVPDSKVFTAANIISTNLVIKTAGTVIDGKEIRAVIDVQAANVTIKNCRIIGPQNTPANRPLVNHIHAAVKNFRLERCTVRPTRTSDMTDTLMGHNITRIRNNISRGVDGSGSYIDPAIGSNCNYLVQGDYIHDLAYYCPTAGQDDNHTHNDGNQHHNGTNVTFEGVAIHGYWDPAVGNGSAPGRFDANGRCLSGNCNDAIDPTKLGRRHVNATFQINQTQKAGSKTDSWRIINCWVYGGASSINIQDTKLAMKTFELRG
ncbi:MAG: hypothetical protein WBP12_01085, partial [Candidatus Saccharimonas sp.]